MFRTLSHAYCQDVVHRCRWCRREVFGAERGSGVWVGGSRQWREMLVGRVVCVGLSEIEVG